MAKMTIFKTQRKRILREMSRNIRPKYKQYREDFNIPENEVDALYTITDLARDVVGLRMANKKMTIQLAKIRADLKEED